MEHPMVPKRYTYEKSKIKNYYVVWRNERFNWDLPTMELMTEPITRIVFTKQTSNTATRSSVGEIKRRMHKEELTEDGIADGEYDGANEGTFVGE